MESPLLASRISSGPIAAFAATAVLAATVGCEPTVEDVEIWRVSLEGEYKMSEWATDPDVDDEVRELSVRYLIKDGWFDEFIEYIEDSDDPQVRREVSEWSIETIEQLWDEDSIPSQREDRFDENFDPHEAVAYALDRTVDVSPHLGEVFDPSESTHAVESIYWLAPYFEDEHQQRAADIIHAWIGQDQDWRNHQGSIDIPRLLEHAHQDEALESVRDWLTTTEEPERVASNLRSDGPEHIIAEIDEIIVERARDEHPEPDRSTLFAINDAETDVVVSYLEEVVVDEESSADAFDIAIDTIYRLYDERGVLDRDETLQLYLDVAEQRTGVFRRSAMTNALQVAGFEGLQRLGEVLSEDLDDYADRETFSRHILTTCNFLYSYVDDDDFDFEVDADILADMLDQDHWPSQLLSIRCARRFELTELQDELAEREDDDTTMEVWFDGERTVGQEAQLAAGLFERIEDAEQLGIELADHLVAEFTDGEPNDTGGEDDD